MRRRILGTNRGSPAAGRTAKKLAAVFVAALVGTAVATCNDGSMTVHELHEVTAIAMTPSLVELEVGEQITLAATATCDHGFEMHPTMTWATDAPDIASVDESGVVTALAFGEAIVTVTAEGISAQTHVDVLPEGTVVGAAGGTVTFDNLVLTIPADALEEPTDIIVTALPDADFTSDPLYIDGTAFEIRPLGFALMNQATLMIRYDPAHVPAQVLHERLRIQERDRQQNRWTETVQNQVNVQAHEVEGQIARFGPFGVVARNADALPVASVVVEPSTATLDLDETIRLDATALDDQGLPLTRGITWSSSNTLIATVTPSGLVTAVDAGDAEISAEADGVIGTAMISVVPLVTTINVVPSSLDLVEEDVVQLNAAARDKRGDPLTTTFAWVTSDASIATVDNNGLLTAVAPGSTTVSASAGGKQGSATVNVGPKVFGVTVTPVSLSVIAGEVAQLAAQAVDRNSNPIPQTFVWSTSDATVATVNASGLVTAVAAGTANVTAEAQGVVDGATVTVLSRPTSIVIGGTATDPLEAGYTLQLTAVAYDAHSTPVSVPLTWTSSDIGIADVDQTGLVTGVARGTATITASVLNVSASVDIKVVGMLEGTGNNLSWPVVFADGIGLTGLAVSDDPGVRPLASEGITVGTLPFFYSGNVSDYTLLGVDYYLQQGANTWRAELIDGTSQPRYDAQIYWGDNVTHQTWKASQPIRVEQTLYAEGLSLLGYNMAVLYGQGPNEMQGTDGTTASFIPTMYVVGGALTVEEITGQGGTPISTVVTTPTTSEVNVGGKIIYGYLLKVNAPGWYRITFTLPQTANAVMQTVGNTGDELIYVPQVSQDGRSSWLDIEVTP